MTRLLEGKRCIVTGGTRGLGLAMCVAFARHGARVALTYHKDDASAEDAKRAITAAGNEPLVFKGSVADSAHVKSTVAAVVSAFGGIDVLVNNAAITQVLPISLLEESDWDELMDVNVKGVYLYSRAVLRHMIRAKQGSILNIGNFASERIIESPIHYAASKSALRGLTEALAREVGRYAIRVNLLAPGLAEVGMAQGLPQHRQKEYLDKCPLGRLARPGEIAEMAAFLVSDSNTFMTGAKVVLDGGL
ncbi:SDR family NAD(P)-dependent oxidoreductase [Polyangium jinanense]|uniref:SDR family oxidoreductase n=1 Tax=Polyangium jinanense TaxID=2829994 RepID=A0A9X3X1F3_9BACT|nr:SDR family oxidoreductase [Polyangium jinanense]MDC3955717.1 SDR family oxidoreductase [Polyangium jinanense]MDC3982359.1 SDR family oxidoreductase [Polyangium jinanense]